VGHLPGGVSELIPALPGPRPAITLRIVYLGIQDKAEPPEKLEGYGYDLARADMLQVRLAGALDALEADRELCGVLGDCFASSFLGYKRNEIERFERFVTDWEFREYAYHL
jgi:glutamine synthetase